MIREPSSKRVKDTHSVSQRPLRRSITSLLAFEVDAAKKTLANSGDNTVVTNFSRKGGWKVSLRPLQYVPDVIKTDQRTPGCLPTASPQITSFLD